MTDSVEYRTLLACKGELVTAFKQDPLTIGDSMLAENLVPPTVSSEIAEHRTTKDMGARRLVECITDKVKLSSGRYKDVIDVLTRHEWLRDVVAILKSNYGM